MQLSTEKDHENYKPHYLYQTSKMQWWIGDESGKEDGSLKNEEKTGGLKMFHSQIGWSRMEIHGK